MEKFFQKEYLLNFKKAGEDFLNSIVDYWLDTEKSLPLPDLMGDNLIESLSISEEGRSFESLKEIFLEKILPYAMPVSSKRYLGMMNPVPNPAAVLGELLKASINQNCSLYKQSPIGTVLEEIVVNWFGSLVGYSGDFFGTIVSGGSVGNLTGLKAARNEKFKKIREDGLFNIPRLRFYVSKERHYSIDRALDIIGVGINNLVTVDVDSDFKINTSQLIEKIESDIGNGYIPCCIIGIAGTTNTGSVDPLLRLYEVSKKYDCWFHVDAAYGGAALLLKEYEEEKFKGIEKADSVVIDPHKWFFIPLESGIVLFKNKEKLKENFSFTHSYYVVPDLNFGENDNFFEYSIQGSRAFRALKIWMGINYFGVKNYRELVENTVRSAGKLADFLKERDDVDLFCYPELGIVTFRYKKGDMKKIYERLEREKKFWFSLTEINGELAFRINMANIRFDNSTFDELREYLINLNK